MEVGGRNLGTQLHLGKEMIFMGHFVVSITLMHSLLTVLLFFIQLQRLAQSSVIISAKGPKKSGCTSTCLSNVENL